MDQHAVLTAQYSELERLVGQFLETIEGIPDEDLNHWRPVAEQLGGGSMNTFASMAVHMVAAARWRIEEQVFDREFKRNRESEFSATASRAEILQQFDTLISNFHELIKSGSKVDLNSLPANPRGDHPTWSRYDWLVTAISHTALHLGHAQIHRQLWLAESATAA